jgi:SSS family solute:Na+ symporter
MKRLLSMTASHYIGAALVLALITGVGIYSGRRVKDAKDFCAGGKRAGAGIVAGTIMGTVVGGSSTIGTAQLAFRYGFSAWWFTLGSGIGCLILWAFYVRPLRRMELTTLPEALSREYGRPVGSLSSVLVSMGMFVNIIAQLLSGIALITAVSSLSPLQAAMATALLMLAYVVFGGVWGTGYVGIVKLILLYAAVVILGALALHLGGGLGAFAAVLPADRYFNLLARGPLIDLGAGASLVLGVISTQTYIQAVLSAESDKAGRQGALMGALLVPPIGLAGIFVGMYMKVYHPEIDPATALPVFILEKMPPLLAGGVLATLLVTLVGTGAGIALGPGSILSHDVFKAYVKKDASDRAMLLTTRLSIAALLALGVLFTTGNLGSLILGWGVMSMGLRAAVMFAPLCGVLFLPGQIRPRFALAAVLGGPLFVLIGVFVLPSTVDPLFLGVGASCLMMLAGMLHGRHCA